MSDPTGPADPSDPPAPPDAPGGPGTVATEAPGEVAGFRPGVIATGTGPQTSRTGPPKGVLRRSTLNRLGPETRSVAVPSFMLLLLSIAAVGMFVSGTVLAVLAIAEGEPSPEECRLRTAELDRAISEYRRDNGEAPRSMTDLVPDYVDDGYPTHTVDFDARPPQVVIFEGGPCDVDGGRAGALVTDDVGKQGTSFAIVAFVAGGLLILIAAGLALPILALQGYWMSVAYRGVLPSRRKYAVRAAYSPLVVYLGGGFLVYGVLALVNAHLRDDPEIGQAIFTIVYIIWLISLVVVIVRWLNMLAQVNHSFGRMSFAARMVKGSLLWMIALNVIGPVLLGIALAVAESAPVVSLVILILLVANLVLTPLVGIVSYVVALILATVQIDRHLRVAADELTRLEQAGWLEVEPARR